MSLVLQGKVAVVTGGGRGIGFGISKALAEEGAHVIMVGRSREPLEVAVRALSGAAGSVSFVQGDITDSTTIELCVTTAIEKHGTVDILVNNAQEIYVAPLLELDAEAFERSWASGPMATLGLMKACHPHLAGGGVVINLLSAAGVRWEMGTFGAYGAAKQALWALTRTAACEWAGDGIRVMGLMPVASTDAWKAYEAAVPDEAAKFVERIPLGSLAEVETIGRAAVFLSGPDAGYITGSVLNVDGGLAPSI